VDEVSERDFEGSEKARHSMKFTLKVADKLRSKAVNINLVFPGHDVLLAADYPKVAEDITRLV
jgi:hypothetical protein